MKAFILAAGRGTRISRRIEEVPKCTLPVAGVPLIRRTVNLLTEEGFEIIVCVGYKAEKVYEALNGLNVKYYYNPFYDITNSIASLWFAKDEIRDDALILNGDVYFSKAILNRILHNDYDVCMAIDKSRTEVGDYFFSTTDGGCIVEYGKELPLSVRSCEYVGLAKVEKSFAGDFVKKLDWLVNNQGYKLWWENVLYSFTNAKEKDIYTVDVEGDFWAEIDYFDDYERIIRHIETEKEKEKARMKDRHRIHGERVNIKPENTREFYDRRAGALSGMPNPYMAVLLGDQNPAHAEQWNIFEKEFILPKLEITGENSVLDIGCGIGRWAESVIPACGYYCGTDFSSGMIQTAVSRNIFPACDFSFHNLSFQEAVKKLPELYKKRFDRLIIGGVCMYINDGELKGCYEGLLNLLDKHCIIYFTETVAAEKRLTLDECPSEALKTNYDVIYRTPEEYNAYYKILTGAGFAIKEQGYVPHLNNEKQFSETDRWYTILERQ